MAKCYTRFNPRGRVSIPLPCLSPGCNALLPGLDLSLADAMLEYHASRGTRDELSLTCSACKGTSTFSRKQLDALVSDSQRVSSLPVDYVWAIVLGEVETSEEFRDRFFFGERVLIRISQRIKGVWTGQLESQSQLAPSLRKQAFIRGYERGNYLVADGYYSCDRWSPLPIEERELNSHDLDCGGFFVSKDEDNGELRCANLPCRNPSCNHFFTLTYKGFLKLATLGAAGNIIEGNVSNVTHALTCYVCNVSRIIDIHSYDNLYKM